MEGKEIKKEYTNGELTIVWKPKICIHSEVCVKTLPRVYHPVKNPWIIIENATTDELISQIKKCPSGALSYYMNNQEDKKEELPEVRVELLENGPLLIHGNVMILDKDGNAEVKMDKNAFCRCGHSNNKPFCDGSHVKIGFKG
jgi:uncharacterized Fe-S cluster protein YjdI